MKLTVGCNNLSLNMPSGLLGSYNLKRGEMLQ